MAINKNTSRGRKILEEIKKRNYDIHDEKGRVIEVPEKGSLGLLAQGYLGVLAVRKKREEILKTKEAENKSNEK